MKTDQTRTTKVQSFLLLLVAIALMWTVASSPFTHSGNSISEYPALAEHENGYGNG